MSIHYFLCGFGWGFAPAGTSGVADWDGFPLSLEAQLPPLFEAHVPLSAKASGDPATIAMLRTMVAASTPAMATLGLNNFVIGVVTVS